MKNTGFNIRDKLTAKYFDKDIKKPQTKSNDINVLLNRIELNKKNESRKKVLFSTAASAGLLIFGLIIF
tara:strand:- start:198 stop:404 length:207 start_codon:yes stop_codon:yes gene_type:complete